MDFCRASLSLEPTIVSLIYFAGHLSFSKSPKNAITLYLWLDGSLASTPSLYLWLDDSLTSTLKRCGARSSYRLQEKIVAAP